MKKSAQCTICVCLGLILLSMPIISTARAAADTDSLSALLPDDTLFCVRINQFTDSLGLLDQYLAGISPMPVSMSMTMMLGGALGDPVMNGVNQHGTLAIAGLAAKGRPEPVIVFLIPITDLKPFTSNANCQGPDENGLYTLNAPGSPMGPVQFAAVADNSYLMAIGGEQAQTLQTAQMLLKSKKAPLARRLNTTEAKNAAAAPVWAWVNLDAGYARVAPLIREGFEQSTEARQQAAMGVDPQVMKGIIDGLDQWMQQADSLSMNLTLEPTLLTAEINFIPKADSELAEMLVRDPSMKSGFTLGRYLDPQSPINGLMKMNKPLWQKFNQRFIEFFSGAMGQENELAAVLSKFKPLMDKSMKAMGSEAAFSFGYSAGTPPFSVREMIEVSDAKTMREMMEESFNLANEMYAAMGLPATLHIRKNEDTYKGISVDKAVIRFTLPDTASEEEKAALESLYGKEGITYPFAVSNDKMLLTMGPNADAELKKLIDLQSNPPAAIPSDLQTAMKIIPQAETADFIMSVNVIRLMKGFAEMMSGMARTTLSEGAPVPPFVQMLEGIPMNTQSAMALGGHIDGGRMQTHIALPRQHLLEITTAAMQIQQKIMMQQMQEQQQQTPPSASGEGPSGSGL